MSSTKTVTIFLAEDHLISRMGLKMLLEQTSHFSVVGEAEDGESAVEQVLETKPEVVMMDLGLPKIDGIEATRQIKAKLPKTKILIFTTAEDDTSIFAALKAGADGYCLKTISGDMLAIAIESVLKGAAWLDPGIAHKVLRAQQGAAEQPADGGAGSKKKLSESKMELLALVEKGKSMEEIALELRLNDSLVKGLLHELLNQLGSDTNSGEQEVKPAFVSTPPEHSGSVTVKPGDLVGGHYKVESLLGAGGMGAVYKAKHTFIERVVAIKTLHEHLASDEATLGRFKIEAQSNAAVVHQNLVSSYDFGLIQGKIPYIVMEYLQGESLQDLLDRDRVIDEKTAKNIFVQICDALHAVHSKGIVHRDLKPSNVMLLKHEDNEHFVKVVDFGIAKILESNNDEHKMTRTGECLGSPLYMSPEQCWGSGKAVIDNRSDLYALGCIMFESLTGDSVFSGTSVLEVLIKHVKEEPSLAPLKEARVSQPTIDLIARLLQKKSEDRPATAREVRECLAKN